MTGSFITYSIEDRSWDAVIHPSISVIILMVVEEGDMVSIMPLWVKSRGVSLQVVQVSVLGPLPCGYRPCALRITFSLSRSSLLFRSFFFC